MSTPYATIYTKLEQAGISQEVAEIAGANIFILGEYGHNPIGETADFIASFKADSQTALENLLMRVERVEYGTVQS